MSGKTYEIFFHHIPNATFIFPNGRIAAFTGGRYATTDQAEAAYLQYEIDQGNQHIFRKEDCLTLAEEDLAPDAEYRKRVIAEYLEQQEALRRSKADLGSYIPPKVDVADTTVIAEAAAGSDSPAAAIAPGTSGGAVAIDLSGIGK